MKVEITIPDYKGNGFETEWDEGAKILAQVDCENNVIGIGGNRVGLTSLARLLLTLSQPSIPDGYHVHFDEHDILEKGSCELILYLTKDE